MNVIGIDPGVNGAIAFLGDQGQRMVIPPPTLWITKGKSKKTGKPNRRQVFNLPALADMLEGLRDGCTWTLSHEDSTLHAVIEDVHSMPRQSAQSTFTMGYGLGVYHMVLTMLRIPYTLVTPQAWKKEMLAGTAKDKNAARVVAGQMFPNVDLGKRADQGRSEALLIAEYRRRQG